jgi:hypothetical protein
MHPTSELYESLQIAYEHFNKKLFDSKLVKVIFTVQRKKGVMGYFAPERWGNLEGSKCHEIAINPSYIANVRLIEVMQTLVHEMVHCWQFCYGDPGRKYYHNKEWANKMMDIGLMPSTTGRPGGRITGQHMSDYIIEGGLFLKTFKVLEKRKKFKLKWIDLMSLPRLYDPIIADPNKSDSTEPDLPAFMANNPDIEVIEESKLVQHEFSSNETSLSELLPDDFLIKPEPPRSTRQRYTCYGCNTKIYGKSNLNVRCEDCDMLFEES